LANAFGDALDKILVSLAGNEEGKKFLPSAEVCSKCKNSHEAEEFLWALCTEMTQTLLSEKFSGRIKSVLEKHNVKALIDA